MQYILTNEIKLAFRIRKKFNKEQLNALKEDIRTHGLYHPILLSDNTLIAGERRLRAIKELHAEKMPFTYNKEIVPLNLIPFSTVAALSLTDKQEIELNENLIRTELTWQERASAIESLHNLRMKQGKSTTHKALASEILGREARPSESTTIIRNSLLLAPFLNDEEVAKAPTEKDALNLIRKKQEKILQSALAEHFQISSTPHTLIEKSIVNYLNKMPCGVFDCIIADPPYGSDMQNSPRSSKHEYDDTDANFRSLISYFALLSSQLCKPQAHAYIFCAFKHFTFLSALFTDNGWNPWPTPLIWYKGDTQGMLPFINYGPHRSYATILFLNKGKKPLVKQFGSDVIVQTRNSNLERGAQKPVELYKNLLARSTLPGDHILDPFCGAGTVFQAAQELNLVATGIDNNPEAIKLCKSKLDNLTVIGDGIGNGLPPIAPES